MYVFFALHLALVGIVIWTSCLDRDFSVELSNIAKNIATDVLDKIQGKTPIRPIEISFGEHSHNILEYAFDDNIARVAVGKYYYVKVNETFPKNANKSLFDRNLEVTTNDVNSEFFTYGFSTSTGVITIKGVKESKDNFITLAIPNSDKKITYNFDVVNKILPTSSNIYLSKKSAKLGSSFYFTSIFSDQYKEKLLNAGWVIGPRDYASGATYFTHLDLDNLYYPSMSEMSIRGYFNLTNYHLMSDDEHIIIDEEEGVITINKDAQPGVHRISNTLGDFVEFTVENEGVLPISEDFNLAVEYEEDFLQPGQSDGYYLGRTVKFANDDVLNDHALKIGNKYGQYYKTTYKRVIKNGLLTINNSLFLRGTKKGKEALGVSIYDMPNHKITLDEEVNSLMYFLNGELSVFIDDVIYKGSELEAGKTYNLKIRVKDLTSGEYLVPNSCAMNFRNDYYEYTKLGIGEYEFKIITKSGFKLSYSIYYKNYQCTGTVNFAIHSNESNGFTQFNLKKFRKIVGHTFLHAVTSFFLFLSVCAYFGKNKSPLLKVAIPFFSAFALGGLSEFIQVFIPQRTAYFNDVLVDLTGTVIYLSIYLIFVYTARLVRYLKSKKVEAK